MADPRQAFLYALALLTRLPVQRWLRCSASDSLPGHAVPYYPLVGALLGLLLWLSQGALATLGPGLQAFLVLLVWVGLTGALHLDGLADCADGYFAAHKADDRQARREKALAVMREPASGAMAVIALILLLLGKWVALSLLFEQGGGSLLGWLLLLALSRAVLLPYLLSTDYARTTGMAAELKQQLSPQALIGATLLTLALALWLWPLSLTLWALGGLVLLTLLWRWLWQRLLGGFTGDTLGALVELSELLLLVVWVSVLH